MPPTKPNDTPFRRKDCRESIFAFGSPLSSAEARAEGIKSGSVWVCASADQRHGLHGLIGALVICIKPTASLPVLPIPILNYEINYK